MKSSFIVELIFENDAFVWNKIIGITFKSDNKALVRIKLWKTKVICNILIV